MHSSIFIANKFLEKAWGSDSNSLTPINSLTPMKILKLVYIAHGWMLGIYSIPLIEEDIEAWRYGPVIPDLYHSIKQYKGNPITASIVTEDEKAEDEKLSLEEESIIDKIYEVYNPKAAMTLSGLTHMQGTPWFTVYNSDKGGQGAVIPTDLIDMYYKGLINNNSK